MCILTSNELYIAMQNSNFIFNVVDASLFLVAILHDFLFLLVRSVNCCVLISSC